MLPMPQQEDCHRLLRQSRKESDESQPVEYALQSAQPSPRINRLQLHLRHQNIHGSFARLPFRCRGSTPFEVPPA